MNPAKLETLLVSILASIDGADVAIRLVGEGQRRFFRVCYFRDERDYVGTGATLTDAFLRAMHGTQAQKTCTRCKKIKPLGEYPKRKKESSDGRAAQCLECDRKRKAKWYPRSARTRRLIGRAERSAQGRSEEQRNQPCS